MGDFVYGAFVGSISLVAYWVVGLLLSIFSRGGE